MHLFIYAKRNVNKYIFSRHVLYEYALSVKYAVILYTVTHTLVLLLHLSATFDPYAKTKWTSQS
jgi:hypothetical protein